MGRWGVPLLVMAALGAACDDGDSGPRGRVFVSVIEADDDVTVAAVIDYVALDGECSDVEIQVQTTGVSFVTSDGEPATCVPMRSSCRLSLLPAGGASVEESHRILVIARLAASGSLLFPRPDAGDAPCNGAEIDDAVWPRDAAEPAADAGVDAGGGSDAGMADAGAADGGTPDAGAADAGAADAG